jgi:hypothetical protein
VRLVRVPADVDREDTLLAGLTARQLAILAAAAVALWLVYEVAHAVLPLPVLAVLATPVGAAAVVLALGRLDGVSADRLAIAAVRQATAPRLLVATAGDVSPVPSWAGLAAPSPPGPLRVPVTRVSADGVVDLGDDGAVLVCRASSLTFSLLTEAEQDARIAAFGRVLNGLAGNVQICVRSEFADLSHDADELEERADTLQHPDLQRAAREHAAFLRGIGRERQALRRAVFVVLRERRGDDAATALRRRVEEMRVGLAAAGIALRVLDGPEVARVLAGTWARSGEAPVFSTDAVAGVTR